MRVNCLFVLILTRYSVGKNTAEPIATLLPTKEFNPPATLHSSCSQALEGFKTGQYDILVATDVASHGIDVQVSPSSSTTTCPRPSRTTFTAWAALAELGSRARHSASSRQRTQTSCTTFASCFSRRSAPFHKSSSVTLQPSIVIRTKKRFSLE